MRMFTRTDRLLLARLRQRPVPGAGDGAIEGGDGYACAGDGDCHLIVVQRAQKKLYEMWRANITGPSVPEFRAGCATVWDLAKQYGPSLRGQGLHLRRRCRVPDDGDAGDLPTRSRPGRVGHAAALHPAQRAHPRRHLRSAGDALDRADGGRTRDAALRRSLPPQGVLRYQRAVVGREGARAGAQDLRHVPVRRRQYRPDHRFGSVLDREVERASGITNNQSLSALTVADFEVGRLSENREST